MDFEELALWSVGGVRGHILCCKYFFVFVFFLF